MSPQCVSSFAVVRACTMEYMVLPSNSSFEYYPDNTLAHYRTRLPKDVNLDGEWEVGLQEISYPNTWFTIKVTEEVYMTFREGDIPVNPPENPAPTYVVPISPGYYPNKGAIIQELKTELSKLLDQCMFRFIANWEPRSNVVTITIANDLTVSFSDTLCEILGLHKYRGFSVNDSEIQSTGCPDLSSATPLTSLYVYCDLVRPRVVGHSMVPLLRVVPTKGRRGENVQESFHHIQFVPMCMHNFHEIEIDIRDDTGMRVPFETGRVVVTLLFRRKPVL